MQKKLIALAVAGLISAPVMAQSNVQIYGKVDMGVTYLGGGEMVDDDLRSPKSRTAIDSGDYASSRVGFRGTEDLGNGLAAFFQIETGVGGDTSSTLTGNRQALLGLRGDFGQVSVGRQWNPSRQFIKRLDPFRAASWGEAENFYVIEKRIDNSIIYTSPNFQGFQLDLTYSRNMSGDEELRLKGEPREDERFAGIVAAYENGPLYAGASYQHSDAGSETDSRFFERDSDGLRQWDVGAAWDFGMVEVSGLFGQSRFETDGASDPKVRQWLLGASAPIGEAGTLKLSYIDSRFENNPDPEFDGTLRGRTWSLGYDHALSKRTTLYAVYSHVNTNSNGEGFYDAAASGPREFGPDDDLGAYEQGFHTGIVHNF